MRKASYLLLAAVLPFGSMGAAEAFGDAYWSEQDGAYDYVAFDERGGVVDSNWRINADPDAPLVPPPLYSTPRPYDSTAAWFYRGAKYQVDFENSILNYGDLRITGGDVTFKLGNDLGATSYTLRLASSDPMQVGIEYGQSAQLTIVGGTLDSRGALPAPNNARYSSLGVKPGSLGRVKVVGADAFWQPDKLYIGRQGEGALEVRDGAGVTSGFTSVGGSSTAQGNILVTGSGSRLETGWFYVGENGQGVLNVLDGGSVETAAGGGLSIGKSAGGIGQALVSGAGSSWTLNFSSNNDNFAIGSAGTGTLRIADGGLATIQGTGYRRTYIGYNGSGDGRLEVAGAGSHFEGRAVTVGYQGQGAVHVSAGGLLTANGITLGEKEGSWGAMQVTGPGSKVASTLGVMHGTLLIQDGGQVESRGGSGSSSASIDAGGSATISGPNSRWDVYTGLRISHGTLTVENAGRMEAVQGSGFPYTNIVEVGKQLDPNVVGRVVVTGENSVFEQINGDFFIGRNYGRGELRVENGGSAITAGTIEVGMFSGTGTIILNEGSVQAQKLRIHEAGALRGVGTITVGGPFAGGDGLINEGTIEPGFSPGTISIYGDFTQAPTETLVMELAGTQGAWHEPTADYDRLMIYGDIELGGALVLSFINGFAPQTGDVFDLLIETGGGATAQTGAFDQILVAGLEAGWLYDAGFRDGTFQISSLNDGVATTIPEPTTLALLGIGAAALMIRRRDRKSAA